MSDDGSVAAPAPMTRRRPSSDYRPPPVDDDRTRSRAERASSRARLVGRRTMLRVPPGTAWCSRCGWIRGWRAGVQTRCRREAARGGGRAAASTCRQPSTAASRAADRRGGRSAAGARRGHGLGSLRWAGGLVRRGGPRRRARLRSPLAVGDGDVRVAAGVGIVIAQERLGPRERHRHRRCAVTTRSCERSSSRCGTRRQAAGGSRALDMAAYSDLVSIREMAAYAWPHSGWTGIPQTPRRPARSRTRTAGRRGSPDAPCLELDAGFPSSLCNRPVFDRSRSATSAPRTCSTARRGGRRVRRRAAPGGDRLAP